jgi:hypothetical protein
MANRSLSPKRIAERTQLHRQAVTTFARLAAKRAVQDNLRAQGVRVSLFPIAEIMRQAREYLDNHPELYQLALERALRIGYIDPLGAERAEINHFGCADFRCEMIVGYADNCPTIKNVLASLVRVASDYYLQPRRGSTTGMAPICRAEMDRRHQQRFRATMDLSEGSD